MANPTADEEAMRRCLAQLDPELASTTIDVKRYSCAGRFLKADCLLLLQWGGDTEHLQQRKQAEAAQAPFHQKGSAKSKPSKRGGFLLTPSPLAEEGNRKGTHPSSRKHWRIVCLDFSIHSLSTGRLRDPNYISTLRHQLLSELGYVRTRCRRAARNALFARIRRLSHCF